MSVRRKQRYDFPIEIPKFNPLESPMQQRAREGVGVHGMPPWSVGATGLFAFAANEAFLMLQKDWELRRQRARRRKAKRKKVGRRTYGSKNYANENPRKPRMYGTK